MKGEIRFRDEVEGIGWVQMPRLVLFDRRLSPSAVRLYAIIRSYAHQEGACFPGRDLLARNMNVAPDSVTRTLRELKEVGLLTVEKRGRPKTNLYYIEPMRAVYPVNEDGTLSDEARETCGLDDRKPESQKPKEETHPVSEAIASSVGLEEVIARAEQKTKESAEKKAQRRSERMARKAASVEVESRAKAPPRVGLTVLEKRWREAFRENFEADSPRWGAAEKKLVKDMMADSGVALVENVLLYTITNWDEIRDRMQIHGYPGVRIISAMRSTLFPEVQSGVVKRRGTKLNDDEYSHGEDDGPAVGRGFG